MALRIFHYTDTVKEVAELKKSRGIVWVDCVNLTKEEGEQLRKTFKLHPLTIEDLISKKVRVKVEEFPDHLFCVFYSLHENGSLFEMDFVLGKNYLITSHDGSSTGVAALMENTDKIAQLAKNGTDFLMHNIFDKEVDHCFEVLEKTGELTEKLEEQVANNPDKKILGDIFHIKRLLGKNKRTFLAQREKTGWLAKSPTKFISKQATPYFRDIYDHSIQLSDALDGYREEVVNTYEVYMSSVSNSMNEVMKVLSVIATITLPLTVISGIYGTNFLNLPGMHTFNGFWYMLLGMFLLSVFMIAYFRKKHWL